MKTKYEVNYQKETTLQCTFEDFPRIFQGDVIWERKDKTLAADAQTVHTTIESFCQRDSIFKTCLKIIKADENDSGFYSCKIRLDKCYQETELRSDDIELCVYGREYIDLYIYIADNCLQHSLFRIIKMVYECN